MTAEGVLDYKEMDEEMIYGLLQRGVENAKRKKWQSQDASKTPRRVRQGGTGLSRNSAFRGACSPFFPSLT